MGSQYMSGWFYQQKPLVWLSTLHMAFGSETVGTSSPVQPVVATDTGSVPVNVTGVTITGPGAAAFTETNDCGVLAARVGFCSVGVQFSPPSAGAFVATLTIQHGVEGINTVTLSGTGI
jgi:hypothetical protein